MEILDSVERITFESNRFYHIQNIWLPSVTSVLKQLSDFKINEWRVRIGVEVADKISKLASERGTRIHSYCERALKGLELDLESADEEYFKRAFSNELGKIKNVIAIEKCLFSIKYGFAGTVDCIGEYNGVMSIIDFKTSTKLKQKRYITSYFLQAAAYSIAYEEMTGNKIDQLVIIIGVADLLETQVFIENVNNHVSNTSNNNWRQAFINYLSCFKQKSTYPH